jgi:hypothetical protein
MQKTEKELKNTIMENTAQEAIAERNRSEAITMAQTESLSTDLNDRRLGQAYHSELLKVFISPDVMVALEEEDLHSPVHQRLKGSKDPDISFRNDITVFVPEIPDVTQQIQSLSILRQTAEKVGKTPLTRIRIRNLQPQMDIRDKICSTGAH